MVLAVFIIESFEVCDEKDVRRCAQFLGFGITHLKYLRLEILSLGSGKKLKNMLKLRCVVKHIPGSKQFQGVFIYFKCCSIKTKVLRLISRSYVGTNVLFHHDFPRAGKTMLRNGERAF